MLKKSIAVFVMIAVFSTSLFAQTAGSTSASDKSIQNTAFSAIGDVTQADHDQTEANDLFADVAATPLTTSEAQSVEGGILLPVLIVVAVVVLSSCATLNPAVRK